MDSVRIFDTTLRDAEQSPAFSMNTPDKNPIPPHLAQPFVYLHRGDLSAPVGIFDTGVRDGEHARVFSKNGGEKIRVAGELAKLGVAVMGAVLETCRAMRFFPAVFMEKPGDCSPSRSVVSNI